jgi:hypothetical protein
MLIADRWEGAMNSFRKTGKELQLPLSAVWLMNSISEYKGRQELYAKQSPQLLKSLVEMAISRDMIRTVFRQLQKQKEITCLGRGRSSKWKRIG